MMNTREKVVEALEKEKGSYVSGEALAKICNVSRNAIWKSIKELRKRGYPIKSVNNRGYMLEEGSDIISKAGILMYLENEESNDPAGKIDPERIHVYEELDSTNKEAGRSLIFNNGSIMHGTVFIAKHQTEGKGHGGRLFSSPDGGIYLSVILEPDKMKSGDVPLPEMIAENVKSVLDDHFHICTEKEKDSSIYLGDEKVCGILTEGLMDMETGVFNNYIVGIGIRAGRLQALSNEAPQKNAIIADIIRNLIC